MQHKWRKDWRFNVTLRTKAVPLRKKAIVHKCGSSLQIVNTPFTVNWEHNPWLYSCTSLTNVLVPQFDSLTLFLCLMCSIRGAILYFFRLRITSSTANKKCIQIWGKPPTTSKQGRRYSIPICQLSILYQYSLAWLNVIICTCVCVMFDTFGHQYLCLFLSATWNLHRSSTVWEPLHLKLHQNSLLTQI